MIQITSYGTTMMEVTFFPLSNKFIASVTSKLDVFLNSSGGIYIKLNHSQTF